MLQSKEQIGQLDRKIRIEKKILGTNVSNENAELGWEAIENNPTPWAKVEEKSGSETYKAEMLTANTVAVFTLRYRTDIREDMRIVYASRYYDIRSILFESRKGYIKITAESGGQYVEAPTDEFTEEFTEEMTSPPE